MKPKQPNSALAASFKYIFGMPLQRFWHGWFGFDVVKFDAWMGTPSNQSLADYIKETKGDRAYQLVYQLINGGAA